MRALVTHSGRTAHRLIRILSRDGWDVLILGSDEEMLSQLEAEPVDVVLVDGSREDLIEQMPELSSSASPPYALVTLRDMRGPSVARAYDMGADEVMASTASVQEILGRAGSSRRFKQRHGLLPVDTTPLDSLETWKDLGNIAAASLSSMLDERLSPVAHPGPPPAGYAAEIVVAMPSKRMRVTLGVGMRERHAMKLVDRLGGARSLDHVAQSLCRELADNVGKAMRRRARKEEVECSSSPPMDVPYVSGPPLKLWLLQGDEFRVRLWVWANASELRPRRLRVEQLRERMVLAQDAVNENGALLVPKGRALTLETVTRLHEALGSTYQLEVIDVDAA